MTKNKLSGTNVTIIQSLLLALSKAQEEVANIQSALSETINRVGREVIGEEGDGQYVISREPSGFFIFWEPKPEEPAEKGASNELG